MSAYLQGECVGKDFGGVPALRSVSFEVREGEIVGLIGPNGAGKSSLFNLIAGVFPLDRGAIYFDGKLISGKSPEQICHLGISRTFQITKPFLKMTILDNVTVGALHTISSVSEAKVCAGAALDSVGLGNRKQDMPATLSLGLMKKLELARALATKPKMLLLDEVMGGLNPAAVDDMVILLRQLRDSGVTLLVVEHIMHAIMALCDRIIVLHHGEKLAEGTPINIAKSPLVIQAYLGEEYQIAPA